MYLYVIYCPKSRKPKGDSNYYKIGISEDVGKRLETLQAATPFLLTPVIVLEVPDEIGMDIEKFLHYQYNPQKIRGEWFDLTHRQLVEIEKYLLQYKDKRKNDRMNRKRFKQI